MELAAQLKVFTLNRVTNEENFIVFEISIPEPIDDGQNYMCTIQITGAESFSQRVGGGESMQALSLAVGQTKSKFEEYRQGTYDFFFDQEKKYPRESFDYSDVEYPEAPRDTLVVK